MAENAATEESGSTGKADSLVAGAGRAVIVLLGLLADRAGFLLVLPVLTSVAGPEVLGQYALLMVGPGVVAAVCGWSLAEMLQRFYLKPEHQQHRRGLLAVCLSAALLLGVGVGALLWVLAPWIASRLLEDPSAVPATRWFAVLIGLSAVAPLASQRLLLRGENLLHATGELVAVVAGAGLSIGMLLHGWNPLESLAIGQVVRALLGAAFGGPGLLFEADWSLASWTDRRVWTEPLVWTGYLVPGKLSEIAIRGGDRVLIGLMLGVEAVGIYDLASRIAFALSIVLIAPMRRGLLTTFFQLEAQPRHQRGLLRASATSFAFIAAGSGLALSLLSPYLVALIGRSPAFAPAAQLVPLLTAALFFRGLGFFYEFGILMCNRSDLLARHLLLCAVANVAFNAIGIPLVGVAGAAVGTLLAYAGWAALHLSASTALWGIWFELRRIHTAFAVAVGLYLVALVATASVSNPAADIGIRAAALGGYGLLLAWTGLWGWRERVFANEALTRVTGWFAQRLPWGRPADDALPAAQAKA